MKKFYYLGLCALLAGAFGACKDDIVSDNGGNSIADMDGETGYLSFRIKSADTGGITRAWLDNVGDDGDYAVGEEAEDTGDKFAGEDEIVPNVQANRVFFFYQKPHDDGSPVANTDPYVYHSSSLLTAEIDKQPEDYEDDHYDHTEDGYDRYEKVFSTTVKRTTERGDETVWPSMCLVVLNGRPSRLNALTEKLKEEDGYDLSKFLLWVNEDLRDSDPEGLTLGLYLYGSGDDGKYYFTMTNSIYFNEKEDQINATKIDAEKLYKTREQARMDPVTVYVERVMAKVEVGFIDSKNVSGTGYFSDDMSEIGFLYEFKDDRESNVNFVGDDGDENAPESETLYGLITNWTINAVEYQTHLFKNINTTWTTGVQSKFSSFDEWNDISHHRSYWAQDPHYKWDDNQYPTQYRKAFGNKAMSYQDFRVEYPAVGNKWVYGEDVKETENNKQNNDIFNPSYPWALDYKSFNSVTTKRKAKYCLENTFDMSEDKSGGYKHMIMGSHLLIQARLLNEAEKDKLGNLNLDEVSDKYFYSDTYYTEISYINNRVMAMNQTLGETVGPLPVKDIEMWRDEANDHQPGDDYNFDDIEGGLWIKDDERNIYKKVVAKVSDSNKEIAATEVFGIAPAYVAKGDGKVTLALLKEGGANGFGYDDDLVNLYYVKFNSVDTSGQPVNPTEGEHKGEDNTPVQFTRNQLVSLIYQVAGIADCFKEGMMYYAVPIQHYIANGGDYDYKFEKVETGDYGVVRNHWYKFTINQIEKPGIPVHDPNQPIIPNYDDEDRYIGLQVIILPWHIVDNGNVTLGPNK